MVHLLRSLGQTEAADELEEYNTSPGRMKFTNAVEIEITKVKAEMKGTLYYSMTKKPRGKCIIIKIYLICSKNHKDFNTYSKNFFSTSSRLRIHSK
jgi:hypothetical protein